MFVRFPLDKGAQATDHDRYALRTLMSAMGIPYRTPSSNERSRPDQHSALSTQHLTLPSVLSPQSSLRTVFDSLARTEEYDIAERDKYGRFLWDHTTVRPKEDAARPIVSEIALRLLNDIKEAARQAGQPFLRVEPWPRGLPMAACLTHDVDVVSRGKLPRGIAVRDVQSLFSSAARGKLGDAARLAGTLASTAAGTDPYWTFDRISRIERAHGYRSTYFVMAGQIHPEDASYDPADPRIRDLMRHMANLGCEIALHGSFGPYTDPAAVSSQKARLESITGRPVVGHRNHVLRFQVPASWMAQEQAGLSYDATLGFADHEGFRGSHAFPFFPWDSTTGRQIDLLEIPLAVMDVTIQKYRNLRGEEARAAIEAVMEQTLAVGGLATLLWHNDTFFDLDFPGCGRLYEGALSWLAHHDAWVATCADVDRWWRARDALRIERLPDGRHGWEVRADREIDGLAVRVTMPDGSPDRLVQLGRIAAGASVPVIP